MYQSFGHIKIDKERAPIPPKVRFDKTTSGSGL